MRSVLLSSALVAAIVATAQGAPVVIDPAKVAAPPRTDPGTGMCMNAVHLGNAVGPYFDVNAAGVMSATMLLDQTFPNGTGMASPPITDVAGQQRYPTINFRNLSPDSVGDFTGPPGDPFADSWFPFTTKGTPPGNDQNFADRVRGYLNIPSQGVYTFALRGDALAQLTIAGTLVMQSQDASTAVLTRQVQFGAPGMYSFQVLHFQNTSAAILEMSRVNAALSEGSFIALDTSQYQLWSAKDLYSAVVGQGNCKECAADATCLPANFCLDSLCQPCITNAHCGPSCKPCAPPRPFCNVPGQDGTTASCVECRTNGDCPSNMCDTATGTCIPLPDLAPPPRDLYTPAPDLMVPPQCTVDTDCPVGQFCQSGMCQSCPPGQEAVPRAPGDTGPPHCVRPTYRGAWACSAAGPGASSPLAGSGAAGGALLLLLGALLLRRRRALAVFFCIISLGAAAESAHAQAVTPTPTANADLQTYQPALGPNNILSVDGSRTPGKTTFFFNLLGDYALHPLRYVDQATGQVVGETVPHLVTIHVMPGVGIGRWFSAGLDLPVVVYQAFGQATPDFPSAPQSYGLGDLRPAVKFRILNNDYKGLGLALVAQATVPLPLDNTPNLRSAGNGNVGIEPRLVLDYRTRGGFQLGVNAGFLGYIDDTKQRIPGIVQVSHQVRYGLGASVPVAESVALFGEVYGGTSVKQEKGGQRFSALEALVGAKIFSENGFTVTLGVGTGILSAVGTPQLRAVFGLGWLPTYHDDDIDKDGVPNKQDRCPEVPGPRENQGCPWPDTDGDGLIDPEDQCPTIPGPKENHGCPDKDTDGDGIIDRLDKCPTVAGPRENQGCPWPDTDKDGIIDPEDKCPLEPGPKENQGCPDKDTDGDGIVDRLDQCPTVPGVPPTGCPERKFIVVTQDKIELKQKIYFATNKSKVLPPSYDLLNEVVEVLKERPAMKLRIEGHTDSRGPAAYNLRLSQARADAVRDYLIQAGIAPDRLASVGYGLTRPIGDNATDEGREKNRRTEFYITEQ